VIFSSSSSEITTHQYQDIKEHREPDVESPLDEPTSHPLRTKKSHKQFKSEIKLSKIETSPIFV